MSLLHAEYLKLSRRKLFPIMLAIMVVLVLISAVTLIVLGQYLPELGDEGIPVLTRPDVFPIGAQQVAGQTWFPMLLGAVVLGGELASTVWATSLTRESSVMGHVVSRLMVFTAASWLAFILSVGAWSVVAFIWAPGSGGPSAVEWLEVVGKLGLVALAWSSLGLAAVSLLRSVGPAIGVVLAFSFLESILAFIPGYVNVSVTAGTVGLFGSYLDGFMGAFIPGGELSLPHSIAILAGWTIIGLGLTWWGLKRRDA